MSHTSNQAYLSHVNGLRAIAILVVVIYHLRSSYCPAGYFGVDIFLVISGYFLFRRLMDPKAYETFHYGKYLLRKAWRIIPPWFVLTLCCCVIAIFVLVDMPARVGFRVARNSAYMIADFCIDHTGNYFNPDMEEIPLLHIWYLSIVCQLYIVAPLLVIPFMQRKRYRAAKILLCVLGIISLLYWVLTATDGLLYPSVKRSLLSVTLSRNPYYHLIPRLWEILAGYAVVFMPAWDKWPKLRSALGLVGLVGMALSFFLLPTGSPCSYPAVCCAMLVIKYGDSGPAEAILGLKPLQFIGTISFSLYLWHWLVMVTYKYCSFGEISIADEACMVALSVAAAWCSWSLIEKRVSMPARDAAACRSWKTYTVLLCLPIVVCASSPCNRASKNLSERLTQQYFSQRHLSLPDFPASEFSSPYGKDKELLKGFPGNTFLREPIYLGNNRAAPSYLFIGDSHAQHLNPGLDRALTRAGRRGIALNNSVLPVWGHIPEAGDRFAARWDKKMANGLLAYLREHPSVRYVVVSLYWQQRVFRNTGENWDNGHPLSNKERVDFVRSGLIETFKRIAEMGRSVVLIGDTPALGKIKPFIMVKRRLKLGQPLLETSYVPESLFRSQKTSTVQFLNSLRQNNAVAAIIDPSIPLFALSERGCPDQYRGNFLYYDDNHLTSEGSYIVGEHIVQQLLKLEPRK